jgi:hypothetical protein
MWKWLSKLEFLAACWFIIWSGIVAGLELWEAKSPILKSEPLREGRQSNGTGI